VRAFAVDVAALDRPAAAEAVADEAECTRALSEVRR
jgi:hypothetical protein